MDGVCIPCHFLKKGTIMRTRIPLLLACAAFAGAGCLAIKTEHEVKPIQITMDVNLKVDKALDQEIAKEKKAPSKNFEAVKALIDRGAVGMDNRGYLVAREDISDDEKDMLEDVNAQRRVRMSEIAAETGAKRADVEKMRVEKMRLHLPSGAWIQDEAGEWAQKK